MSASISELEARRDRLRAELGAVGDLRPGTLVERYRKCGKPSCHCAREGDPGHGPVWTLVFSAKGKSKTRVIPPDAVAATRTQIEECRRLRRLPGGRAAATLLRSAPGVSGRRRRHDLEEADCCGRGARVAVHSRRAVASHEGGARRGAQ